MENFSDHHIPAVLGLLTFLILLYNLRWLRNGSHRSKKGPPEPKGSLSILGHIHLLRKEPTFARTLASMADKYGPIFAIRLGVQRAVVISRHDLMKECFTANDLALSSRPQSSNAKYLSYNFAAFAFASYSPFWRKMRKMVVVQLLSGHRIKSLRHVQVSEVDHLIEDLYLRCKKEGGDHNKKIDISECFEFLSLNIITRMIAGKRYSSSLEGSEDEDEKKRVVNLMKEYMYISQAMVPSDMIPMLWWMNYFPGPVKQMKHLAKEFDLLVESWIDERKSKRLNKESNMVEDKDLLIDVMLNEVDDDFLIFGHTKEDIIKGTIMSLIVAGADTTSITLTWIFSNLLNNRHTLELAQQELDQKVGKSRRAQDSDIDNLVYIQAIVKETLRLYPPAPVGAPREAIQDCTIGGYHIPKGTRILTNLWKLHRDPEVWSNPDEFMPERFISDKARVDAFGQNFEYMPFGSGRRSCPGLHFSMEVLHLAVARLIQGFDITAPGNRPVDMSEGFSGTLPKASPLEIQISPRLSPQLYEF